ncbi:Bug family tripartite tricarboxylate transporter substrate binding protein [Roseibium limicola]|uniref:Tripartite tricarboxylate transporter substrate binding protein n=1 Tax=Roseibium limicola TaxID=2816037 RepID=A0A939ELC4_9HYPH|nr:tripartite tricarboxylate transporter substrate binding protein [Roseibium limicola]MBO0344699.1 tripartite tricarboxylate transporter substrate binding protein [Roseibium limicola]
MNKINLVGAAIGGLLMTAPAVAANDWPTRPVSVIVAYGAGGGTDTLSRIVVEPLSEVIGQPVVVENRPGAGGTMGADAVANAKPDGYTLYMMANGHTVAGAMYANLPYDAANDFQGISEVASMPLIVVARPDFEANTFEELVALALEKPGELNFASVGVGSSQHFTGALMAESAGLDIVHIPYQKTPEALAAVLSGEVDILIEVLAPMLGQVKAGDVKALGLTSAKRHPQLPDLATVSEAGVEGFDVSTWYGFAMPKGADVALVEKIAKSVAQALESESLINKLGESGFIVKATTPDAFTMKIGSEITRWQAVREKAGIPQR